jgi:hypothetical protein
MNGHDLAQRFLQANPALQTGQAPPPPEPASHVRPCATPVVQSGGALASLLMHPAFTPLEQLYRKLPEEGMFLASPQRNFRFELGAFQVPSSMTFLFVDYSFRLYRLSGAAAGDTVPLEERRLSTLLGFDVTVDAYRKGNLMYQLDPTPIEATKQAYNAPPSAGTIASGMGSGGGRPGIGVFPPSSAPQGATQAQFNAAPFARSAAPGGAGLSLLPQRSERQGALPLPFTYLVESNQRVQFSCTVFKPIPIPLAFIEVDVTGVLMPSNVVDTLLEGLKSCTRQGY